MGFSLSELERNRLIEEGFSPDMISTGDKPFKFLGCQIKPSFLRDGAVCRLSELCDDMQEIANAFNDEKTTLKGRRLTDFEMVSILLDLLTLDVQRLRLQV